MTSLVSNQIESSLTAKTISYQLTGQNYQVLNNLPSHLTSEAALKQP